MSIGEQIAWDDTVLPFQLDNSDIRGRVARLDGALEKVLEKHNYPPLVEALVAEATLLTAMIGQTIKLRWKLSLQIRGDGPLRLIATDYYAPEEEGAPARIRAYASFDGDRLAENTNPYTQIGQGYFAILIDQGPDMTPYQGITPLAGQSLSACAETYFAQSEQLPTPLCAVLLGAPPCPVRRKLGAQGGVMLQHMPGNSEAPKRDTAEQAENWTRANMLLDTVEELELIGPHVGPPELLARLFHEEAPRVYDPQPVHFGCSCSEDKVRSTLSIYSAKDIATMTTEDGKVTADCQFCGAHYVMDPATLGFEGKDG